MKEYEKLAIISGVAGQDGVHLLDLLVQKGYFVIGLTRRFIKPLIKYEGSCCYFNGDIVDFQTVKSLVSFALSLSITNPKIDKPIEIYHLAALSHVRESFDNPTSTINTNVSGTTNILESVRICSDPSRFRIYLAGSSEMYGNALESPQNELSKFSPYSPYGVSKVLGFELGRFYRQSFSLFVCNGILFNHESEIRPKTFVTRKITSYVASFSCENDKGKIAPLQLGSLDITRDWGSSKDYVYAMWLMLQKNEPLDIVIASGKSTSVRSFVELAFSCIGISLSWKGLGLNEKAYISGTQSVVVEINEAFYRPSDGTKLVGDPRRAREELNWEATTSVKQIIESMIHYDISEIRKSIL